MANLVTDSAGDAPILLNFDDKKAIITDRLQKREEDRLEEVQKRKDDKEKRSAAEEKASFFSENFAKAKMDVENDLEKSEVIAKSDLSEHFDSITLSLQKLQKFLSDSTIFLPSFDIRQAQETVAKLQTTTQEKREKLMPKKKFAFKSKKKVTDKADSGSKPVPCHNNNLQKYGIDVPLTDCGYKNIKSQKLLKNSDEINAKDVALSNLEDCVVEFRGAPCAIHIDKLKNCKIFSGPVAGSIFVDDCVDCVFVVACQQLRVHTTTKSQFYLHVTSRAIIEDCNDVEFAPYNWNYEQLKDDYRSSGLDLSRNNWHDVDDFNWLANDKASPNWKILPEDKRITSWD